MAGEADEVTFRTHPLFSVTVLSWGALVNDGAGDLADFIAKGFSIFLVDDHQSVAGKLDEFGDVLGDGEVGVGTTDGIPRSFELEADNEAFVIGKVSDLLLGDGGRGNLWLGNEGFAEAIDLIGREFVGDEDIGVGDAGAFLLGGEGDFLEFIHAVFKGA